MPEVYGSAELLVAAVADGAGFTREPFDKNADSLSGSPFESVVIAGVTYVLKHLGRDIDWIMRAFGDGLHGAPPRVVVMWQAGLFEELPDVLDHALVGASFDRDSGRAAILMRDIGSTLVPTGTAAIGFAQHRRFLDHMAALHAAFWDFVDSYGLAPPDVAYAGLTPAMSAREAAAHHDDPVPRAIPAGWAQLQQAASPAYEVALALATDPMPLVKALAQTPSTLVHGDWKFGNLGSHPDGRTVLLDWAWSGRSAGCTDLGWYLAVNCDRLPESKEDTMAAYRSSLERRGVATTPWWDRQLELSLLGAFVQLGWSKTTNPAELTWWTTRVVPVGRRLLQ